MGAALSRADERAIARAAAAIHARRHAKDPDAELHALAGEIEADGRRRRVPVRIVKDGWGGGRGLFLEWRDGWALRLVSLSLRRHGWKMRSIRPIRVCSVGQDAAGAWRAAVLDWDAPRPAPSRGVARALVESYARRFVESWARKARSVSVTRFLRDWRKAHPKKEKEARHGS